MMANEYTVHKMRQLSRISDEGGIEQYWRVEAVTRGGTRFEVSIPDKDMSPEVAKQVLLGKAKQLDAIAGL